MMKPATANDATADRVLSSITWNSLPLPNQLPALGESVLKGLSKSWGGGAPDSVRAPAGSEGERPHLQEL